MTADPRVTIIIPAYEEGDAIVPCLDRIFAAVSWCCEVAVVVDSTEDATVPVLADYAKSQPQLRTLVNTYGPGPANAPIQRLRERTSAAPSSTTPGSWRARARSRRRRP